jgi:putative ABC transport system ATP-binding protein
MALLKGVVESEGVTVLVATHDPVMMALADRVLHISDGRVG